MQSAFDLLKKQNILTKNKMDAKKHPKHEFQAFAYKIAYEFDDLANLRIYLRLTKIVPWAILEEAYSFTKDSKTPEKSKLFLWKVKTIRKEILDKKNLENYDYDFVNQRLKLFRKKYVFEIIHKHNNEFIKEEKLLSETIGYLKTSKKINVLMIGSSSDVLMSYFLLNFKKIKIINLDISKEINLNLKHSFLKTNYLKDIKFITKDFLKNRFKDKTFDLIILNNYWLHIPIESEENYLENIKRVLKDQGQMFLGIKSNDLDLQEWKKLLKNNNEIYSLVKKNNKENFYNKLIRAGFGVISENQLNDTLYLLIQKQSNQILGPKPHCLPWVGQTVSSRCLCEQSGSIVKELT